MILLTWVLLGMSVLVAVFTAWYLKKGKIRKTSNNQKPRKKNTNEELCLEDIFEIESIKEGVIELTHSRYRMIMRLSSVDFNLLSLPEQTSVEDCLISAMMGLSFPIQIITTSEAVDTSVVVEQLHKSINYLNPELQKYAINFGRYMENLKAQRASAMKSSYVVIPFDTDKGFEHAKAELLGRAAILADALISGKMQSELLGTAAIVNLLHHFLNRGSLFKPSEADEAGIMGLIHVSEREVSTVA